MLTLSELPNYTHDENIRVDVYLTRDEEHPVESFMYHKEFKTSMTERLFRWYGHKAVFGIEYDHERQMFVAKVALTLKVETSG